MTKLEISSAEGAAAVVADAKAVTVLHFLDEPAGEVIVEQGRGDEFVEGDDGAADDLTTELGNRELTALEEASVKGVGIEQNLRGWNLAHVRNRPFAVERCGSGTRSARATLPENREHVVPGGQGGGTLFEGFVEVLGLGATVISKLDEAGGAVPDRLGRVVGQEGAEVLGEVGQPPGQFGLALVFARRHRGGLISLHRNSIGQWGVEG